MTKRNNGGFTLIEALAAIVVVVLLIAGIGVGMNAATKAYKESTYQSNCGTLSGILTTGVSDILRYSENVSGAGENFTFTNRDRNVKNCSFTLNESGYLMLHTVDKDGNDVYTPVVNEGAYAGSLKLTEFKAVSHEAANNTGYYFDVSFTIQDINDSALTDSHSFHVRQINADLPADSATPLEDDEDPTVDADKITIVYNQNTPTTEAPAFTDIFGNKTRTVTQMLYPTISTAFTPENGNISRDWYTFKGWNTSADGKGTHFSATDKVILTTEQVNTYAGKELNLYAEWELKVYTLVYNPNEGTISTEDGTLTQQFTYETREITLDSGNKFSKTGVTVTFNANIGNGNEGDVDGDKAVTATCSVSEWNSKADGTGISYTLGQTKVDATALPGFDKHSDTVTLYARWSTAKITFPGAYMQSTWGKKWDFIGWSTTQYATTAATSLYHKDDTLAVSKATTFYAQYEINVIFDLNGGASNDAFKSQLHRYGQTKGLKVPTVSPTKTGYTFKGWYDNEEKDGTVNGNKLEIGDDEYMAKRANATITCWHAKWDINEYTVDFNMMGHGSAIRSQNINHGDKVEEPGDPVATGYKFEGWYTNENFTGTAYNFDTSVTGSFTLYAKWTAQYRYKIGEVNRNVSGRYTTVNNLPGTTDYTEWLDSNTKTYTLTVPTRDGYTFAGWDVTATNGGSGSVSPDYKTLTVNGVGGKEVSVTLTANWTPKSYTVKLYKNDHTSTYVNYALTTESSSTIPTNKFTRSYSVELNGNSIISDETKTGTYTFSSWNTSSGGTGDTYSSEAALVYYLITNNLTTTNLYAQWTINSVTIPNASKTGYRFDGWYKSNGTTKVNVGSFTPASGDLTNDSMTLTAHWTPKYKYTYTVKSGDDGSKYKVDSGTLPTIASTDWIFANNQTITSLSTPTRKGYTFKNWTVSSIPTGKASVSGNTLSVTGVDGDTVSVTLTANWTKIEYNVYLNRNDGTGTVTNVKAYADDTTSLPNDSRNYKVKLSGGGVINDDEVDGSCKFNSWNTLSDGAGTTYSSYPDLVKYLIDNSKTSITLFAQWTINSINLPAATATGYTFDGWYKGTTYINKGDSYTPAETDLSSNVVNLTSHWTPKTYTITYSVSPTTHTFDNGEKVSSPTKVPAEVKKNYNETYTVESGYGDEVATIGSVTVGTWKFTGWSQSGTITITDNVTITGSWTFTPAQYTVTFDASRYSRWGYGKTDVLVNYGSKVEKPNRSDVEWYKDSSWNNIYNFNTAITGNLTLYARYNGLCVASDTCVTLANGTQRPIKDITTSDKLLAFNHETGKYEETSILVIFKSGEKLSDKLALKFSDNSELEIIGEHGLFDYTEMKYVTINESNVDEYVGHTFVKYDESTGKNTTVVLKSYEIRTEKDVSYSIITSRNINVIANGLLTVSDEIEGLYNFFEYDPDLKYNAKDKAEKIAKYGISPYSEWSDYATYEHYRGFVADYSNIAIGEGLTTKEQLLETYRNYYSSVVQ